MRPFPVLAAAFAAALPTVTACALEWAVPPLVDPLRMASLPLDTGAARELDAGEWTFEVTAAYFNVSSESWHTAAVHREFGRDGEPLEPWELRLLEQRHPEDDIYRVDVEGWRSDVTAAVGLGRGLTASLRVAQVGVGTPHWDAVADGFHDAFGLGAGPREYFARGQNVVYVRGRDGSVEGWSEIERLAWADTTLSLAGPAGRGFGARHRWMVAIEAPTGRRRSLAGSGGWDAGVRWIASWGEGRRQTRAALGYTVLDGAGDLLGQRRSDTWHALVELRRPLRGSVDWRASARFDGSPLAALTGLDPGEPAFFLTVGAAAPLGASGWVSFDLGENYPIKGVAPDFTFHVQIGSRLRRGSR